MMTGLRQTGARGVFGLIAILAMAGPAFAQIPGLPSPVTPAKSAGPSALTGGEKPKPAVAATTGPITVHQQVPDRTLERFLGKFLPKYPGVREISATVDDGVVTLKGQVDDDDSRDEITDVVKRVEGVRVVMNQMSTDDEVMTAWQSAARELGALGDYFQRNWLLMILAAVFVAASALLARLFAAKSETILAPFVRNILLRSVIGSVISSLLVIGGLMLALGALRLTHLVLSIVGVASIVGLAVGFAFRDITENFIASVLLGLRRPFQIGDYITVAGQAGVVRSLNTRATVLVTLDGNHVRIPNATVFKEIMINSTASPSFRNSFDVVIPNEASTADALAAVNRALKEQNGILADPPPRALVEALESDGVRIRANFWAPTQNVDWFLLLSEVKLRTKVALQQAGVIGGAAHEIPARSGKQSETANGTTRSRSVTAEQAAANLARDATSTVSEVHVTGNGRETPMEKALDQPETRVSEEGANLLKGSRSE